MKTLLKHAGLFAAAILFVAVTGLGISTPAASAEEALAPGSATGTLTIDDKTVSLKHAYAMRQPNQFEKKKTDVAVLLTDSPLAEGALKDISELGDAAKSLTTYALFQFDDAGEGYYMRFRHPSLGDNNIQISGNALGDFTFKAAADKAEGVLKTKELGELGSHKYRFDISFAAAIAQATPPDSFVDTATAAKLGADGGEPGKAYFACLKSMKAKDVAGVKKCANPDKMPPTDEELKQLLEMISAMAPEKPQITAGYGTDDRAMLFIKGTMMGDTMYGTVTLKKTGGAWKIFEESWSNNPPEK